MKLQYISKGSFIGDVNQVVQVSSILKMELFKSSYEVKRVDVSKVQKYLSKVNEILAKYCSLAENLVDAMKNSSAGEDVMSIPYADVKPFLYVEYDYASALKYLDGLYKGINDGHIKSQKDIDDFFENTTGMAFKDLPTTIGTLTDELSDLCQTKKVGDTEAKKFNAVKEQKLFDSRDRQELYKTIEKVVKYLCDEINEKGKVDIDTDDITMRIAFFVSAIDYLNYEVAAFIGRVFVINTYAYDYCVDRSEPVAVTEAADHALPSDDTKMQIKVMVPADDANYREPKDFEKLIGLINEFAGSIGTNITTRDLRDIGDTYFTFRIGGDNEADNDNIFVDALLGNALYEFILNKMSYYRWDDSAKKRQDFSDEFDALIHNKHLGLSTSISSKQEMLPIIRDLNNDKDTISEYQKVVHDLGQFALEILSFLRMYFFDGINWRSQEATNPNYNNSALNANAEAVKAVKELYGELAGAILYRLRDIELKYNTAKQNELDQVFADISIKVPGGLDDDISHTHDTMDGVPDTAKLPVDLYAMPTYESLQMYAEYAKSVLGDDKFFNEAVDFSKFINTLQSLVTGWFKKAIQFFDGPKLKAASQWVHNNAAKLRTGMTYNGPMEVLPYQENINYPSMEKFINKLTSFTDDDIKDEESLNKFIDGLYDVGDAELTKIFKNAREGNTSSAKLDNAINNSQAENYILFGVTPGTAVKSKQLENDAAIKKEMEIWISTVAACSFLRTSFINNEKKATSAVNAVKSRIVSTTAKPSTQAAAPTLDSEQKEQTAPAANNDGLKQQAITKIQTAFNQVVFPSYMIFRRAITDQYNYIKTAYSSANK